MPSSTIEDTACPTSHSVRDRLLRAMGKVNQNTRRATSSVNRRLESVNSRSRLPNQGPHSELRMLSDQIRLPWLLGNRKNRVRTSRTGVSNFLCVGTMKEDCYRLKEVRKGRPRRPNSARPGVGLRVSAQRIASSRFASIAHWARPHCR